MHNHYEREQAAILEFYPEGRRVLSVQHLSKDVVPFRVQQQKVAADTKFNAVEIPKGGSPVLSNDHIAIEIEDAKNATSEESELGYADTVSIEDAANDLSYFEELDGFNYVANKEKHEAHLKHSDNIRVDGNHVLIEEDNQVNHFTEKDNVKHNMIIDPNVPGYVWKSTGNVKQGLVHKNQWHGKHLFEKADLLQYDLENMPLHEQQLLERNIVEHKPIKPNLPPEEDHYDAHFGSSRHNAQPGHYFYPKDNRHVKSGEGKLSLGKEVKSYAPNIVNSTAGLKYNMKEMDFKPKSQVEYFSSNNGVTDYNIQPESYKKIPDYIRNYQSIDPGKQLKHNDMYGSQKWQNLNSDLVRNDKYKTRPIMQQFGKQLNITGEKENSDTSKGKLFDPNQINDNVHFVDRIIQQQSPYQQTNQEVYVNALPRNRRKKKKRVSIVSIKSQNNTSSFEAQRQNQLDNANHVQSAFPTTQQSSVLNIYMKPNGRLGNQMFEIASLYGIAQRTGRKSYMSQYSDIYLIFPDANRTAAMGEASDDLGILFEEKPGMFSSDLFNLPPTDLIICCYFQSWKYFDGYQSEIRRMFYFSGKIRKLAKMIIGKAKHVFLTQLTDQANQFGSTHTLTYIGVHVRRGDLQLKHHLRRGYRPAPLTYFHKAMDYYRQRFPNTIFLVTSDNIEWCKVKLGSSDVFFVEGQHEAVDLAVLSMTNHTVISVGTFGWWAGWLAGGQVIYYRNWPTPNSEIAKQYEHSDYFLPKWRSMGD